MTQTLIIPNLFTTIIKLIVSFYYVYNKNIG